MSNIFAAPGQSARNAQEDQQHAASGQSTNLLNAYAPYVQNQIAFQKQQQLQAQGAVQGLGAFTTQAGRNGMVNAYAQNARGQAQTAAAQTPGQFAGNSALSQAYQLSAYNGANRSTSEYSQQINSPQGMASAYQTYLGGLQSQSPDFQGIGSLTGNIYNQPQVQVGQGLMGYLSGIAGNVASAYSGGMMGKASAAPGGGLPSYATPGNATGFSGPVQPASSVNPLDFAGE